MGQLSISVPAIATPPKPPFFDSIDPASKGTDIRVPAVTVQVENKLMDRFSCDTSPAEDRDQSSFELGASGLSEDIPLSLLQPSTSIDNVEPSKTVHHPQRHLGIVSSLALVIGMEIGSGIFSSPGVIVANTKSIGASLLVWFVSGCLAWTGASSFAELGSAIPLDGGAQAYLAYAYGPLLSYLFSWTAVSALKPGSAAIISLIFGEYLNKLIYSLLAADDMPIVPEWSIKITACLAIASVTAINLLSNKSGSHAQIVLTSLKVASLCMVIILGALYLFRIGSDGVSGFPTNIFEGSSKSPSEYALALYSGLWAFDGWDQCNYVGGQMSNPSRDMPLTIHIAMSSVIILYLFVNTAYFFVLPIEVLASSNTVGLDYGKAVLGHFGATLFSIVVAISTLGALNGSMYTTAHLISSSATDGFLPKFFSHLSSRRHTPDNAIFLQCGLSLGFILFGGGFRSLVNFFSVNSWIFYLLTVFGLLVLRVKEPNLKRPYRTFLITPILFCLVAVFLLCMPIFAAPLQALAAVGIPAYYLTVKTNQNSDSQYRYSSLETEGANPNRQSIWKEGFFEPCFERVRDAGHAMKTDCVATVNRLASFVRLNKYGAQPGVIHALGDEYDDVPQESTEMTERSV